MENNNVTVRSLTVSEIPILTPVNTYLLTYLQYHIQGVLRENGNNLGNSLRGNTINSYMV